MAPLIQLKDVTKVYSLGEVDVHALSGVNLEIYKGEFVSIIGHSGSGKSTLMNMMGLLDQPTTGKITLEGQDVSTMAEDQLAILRNIHIGFIFQTFNLLSRTTAVDNVTLPLIYAGVEKEERLQRATKALQQVGLGERLNHHPSQLSGGQQQRVAIARALVNKPRIIFADEPTGNLDTASGEEVMDILGNLNSQGNTIVLVTHELDIARAAKRIVEVRDGKIIGDVKNGKHKRK